MRCLLLLLALGLGLGLLAPPMASAQIPDLEALERELERRKEEQARQEAEARRRAEAEARRQAEAEARRRAEEQAEAQRRAEEQAEAQRRAQEEEALRHEEMLAGPRWHQFERVSDGVMDWGQNVIWAARDHGQNMNWRDAHRHCRAMGSGWSLPSVAKLKSLYAQATPHSRQVSGETIRPATNLIQFTGAWYWSSETIGSADAWLVMLTHGFRLAFRQSYGIYYRALCVRRP